MEFRILGPLWVGGRGGAAVDLRRGLPRTLLVALIVRAPEPVSVTRLTDLLWGDDPPKNPDNALQTQISYLRKALTPAGGPPLIVTEAGGYALAVEPDQIDARRFEALVRSTDEDIAEHEDGGDPYAAIAALDDALHLWRGEPLADAGDVPFAIGEITRLTELFWQARERRLELLLAIGRHGEAVSELAALVSEQPLRERFHEQFARALYRCGRQADALRAVAAAREILVEELGVNPGAGLQALERQILDQDPALDPALPRLERHEPGGEETPVIPARAASLPVPLTPLIGRDAEALRIRDLLRQHRMVTLTGPGGAGKSRLALEIAHDEAADAAVWLIDLGSVVGDELVATTVAAAIGVPTIAGDDAGQAVARAVARQSVLFVFDTCEHVIAGVAALTATLLAGSADTRVLATSRRAVGIGGEIAWPVPPLASAPPTTAASQLNDYPSAQLFSARAEAVRADFRITDANAADIAAICLALDGLPLAIELAAARVDVLTPAALRARLQNRFDLLVDGGRDAAPRQQTLKSAVDWSFELLDPAQRSFFCRLGVFHGSFELDAAIAVAGVGVDNPLAVLTSLVRQSMVVSLGDDRYRLLDTLRMYALQAPDSDDRSDAFARHADYYVNLAEEAELHVRGDEQLLWLDRLRTDLPNFRAAAEWSFAFGDSIAAARLAGALAWFWTLDGMLGEAIRHLERAVGTDGLPPLVRAKALWGLALLAASLGELDRSRAAAAESVALGRAADDAAATGCGLNALAVAEWALGNRATATALHDEAIGLFTGADDLWGIAICRVLRARTAIDDNDPAAEAMISEGLVAAHRCGDRHVVGIALDQTARLQLARGNVADAVATASAALAAQDSIGYTEGVISALHLMGRAQALSEQFDAAESTEVRALELAERIGHVAGMCEALEALAQLRASAGRDAEAFRLLRVAAVQRGHRKLPLRPTDAKELDQLSSQLEERLAAGAQSDLSSTASSDDLAQVLADLFGEQLTSAAG